VDCSRTQKVTSSSASLTKALFASFDPIGQKVPAQRGKDETEYVHYCHLPISAMVDDYNHFINGVDIADQLRAKFSTEQCSY